MVSVHVYPNSLTSSSRILKETEIIKNMEQFDKVYLVGIWEKGLKTYEELDEKRVLIRLKTIFSVIPFLPQLRYIGFYLKLFFYFLFKKNIAYIHAHNLGVMPVCSLLAFLKSSNLIYDTHELSTEVVNLTGTKQRIARFVEKSLINRASSVIVVSESIKSWYKKTYKLDNVYLMRNIPSDAAKINNGQSTLLRDLFHIPEDHIVFIYQGLINKERGTDILLSVFENIQPDRHIVFMGKGPMADDVIQKTTAHPNIHYLPSVPPGDVIRYTSSADIGVHTIVNNCLNHYYCLPNKVFEYVLSGLPVIVTGLFEMKNFVEKYNVGYTFETQEELQNLIANITHEDIERMRLNTKKAYNELSWEKEAEVLHDILGNAC